MKAVLSANPEVAVLASEEDDSAIVCSGSSSGSSTARYAVVFDPLDGSRNIDAAIPTGACVRTCGPRVQQCARPSRAPVLAVASTHARNTNMRTRRHHLWRVCAAARVAAHASRCAGGGAAARQQAGGRWLCSLLVRDNARAVNGAGVRAARPCGRAHTCIAPDGCIVHRRARAGWLDHTATHPLLPHAPVAACVHAHTTPGHAWFHAGPSDRRVHAHTPVHTNSKAWPDLQPQRRALPRL
jgi:hypothetical protein